ncbi:hypothetical protein D9619_011808 [Psilocybe cf. subviscida]|uniref:FAD dependent oxidoreductase domain-containing protein n=1 Tax=Psilocybe cf. subviscida TaxID=2480587 RepID=A0A8H5EW83_9AGAR|nr:hypothetical protein D9619_011808 [Psilocybe cf. subviscida]
MGGLFSSIRFALQTLKNVVDGYDVLSKRISLSPGIPQCNNSLPYWTVPLANVAHHGRDQELPLVADVVIIGSGITGTSVAKALLEQASKPLTIVMLEAREACSGATGRNGGHIAPNIYNEYSELKEAYGKSTAQDILRFRLAHISILLEVAKEEHLQEESQARLVEHIDAFLQPEKFARSQRELEEYLRDVSKDLREGFESSSERTTIDRLQLASSIMGCIFKPGAAIHPYRLITGLLQKFLTTYSNFYLYTHTPCTQITSDASAYTVITPRGEVRTPHVIHATNAWASHLLPGMRRKIIPTRAHMSTQRPGKGLSPPNPNPATASSMWAGSRAFVFYPGKQENAFDYLTQLLPSAAMRSPTSLPTAGEFMFGGGAMLGGRSESAFMDNIGVADDSGLDFEVEAYLSGALERYFSDHWGQEGDAPDVGAGVPSSGVWGTGRVKAAWTGIIALSADMQPWVGRVPQTVSRRKEPPPGSILESISVKQRTPGTETPSSVGSNTFEPRQTLAKPGEWICAGYTGEGMVHAWLSGQAVAQMVLNLNTNDPGTTSKGLDKRTPDLPKPFLISEKRIRDARVEYLLERVGG